MKAIKLTGTRSMEMFEVPTPVQEKPDDVLLRMSVVGVCGSDVHYYTHGNIGSQVVEYPFTVGHECSAVVEAVGKSVSRVRPGDRVAVEPAISCHQCDQCLAGRPHTCRELRFLGCPGQAEGCLSEYILMPERCCFPVPESMSMEDAALSEPLTIGHYAVRQSLSMKDARVAVLGAGPIGLSVLLCAKALGARNAIVTDLIDSRLDLAGTAGADWTGNPASLDIVQESGCRDSLDVVFECCGQQEAIDQAVDLLRPGGKLMLIGIPVEERISFIIDRIRRKEICIQNVRRQCDCLQLTLDLMTGGDLDPSFMVTHRFEPAGAQEAFDIVADYRDGVVKAMVDFT